jgi:hypothetical protein
MELREFQLDRILPTLVTLGYDQPVRKTRLKNGCPFDAKIDHKGKAEWQGGYVTLYADDCYPVTSKDEAVLHVWSWAGSPSKWECKRIAEALTRAGIPARPTTYKKLDVVAFDAGDWMGAGSIESEAA